MTSALPLFPPMPWDDAELREEVEGEFKLLGRVFDRTMFRGYQVEEKHYRTGERPLPTPCQSCGKQLPPSTRRIRKFCSNTCAHRFYKLEKAGPRRTRCVRCNKKIRYDENKRHTKPKKYCSRKCSRRAQKEASDVKEDHQGRRPEGAGQEDGDGADPR